MKKLLITLCGTAVLLSVSNFASAEGQKFECKRSGNFEGKGPGYRFSPEKRAEMQKKRAEFRKKLNLTEEQQEKMKSLHEASREKMKSLFVELRKEKAKLKQLRDDGASKEKMKLQMQKIHKIKAQKKELRKTNFEKMQTFLTPEQQKEFNKMHEEHKKKMKNKFKNKKYKFDFESEK